ncbi:type I polyketide synthase [Oleiphilus sp. HI0117]|uniref:type I polyketide synthase n=1 Tax=Oleiphilus sp. HI0117 TaxID=1822261 RepID=UPI001E48C200|nr:type I polyketide synthase [Oleiphilus sp. HI0117]
MKEVITAGEQLIITEDIRSIFEQLPKTSLSNQYGPSESHVVSELIMRAPASDWPEIPPIGSALPHAKLNILNDNGQNVRAGEVGELYISGPVLATGYINNSIETNKRFVTMTINGKEQLCYRTGDLVSADNKGQLVYSGRTDNQVKISGYRIELSEIEACLMKHESVSNAAVTVSESEAQKSIIAFIVSNSEDASILKAYLTQELPAYMQPSHFLFSDALMTTPSGKIDRKSMLAQYHANQGKLAEQVSSMQKEQLIAVPDKVSLSSMIYSLLGNDNIDTSKSLVDVGMTSLMANQLSVQLYESFQLDIPAYKLFQYASIDSFINHLSKQVRTNNYQTRNTNSRKDGSRDIAIIGMAINAPGANNLPQFWENLLAEKESLHVFAPTSADGEVNTRGIIAEPLALDASFFGISPIEAEFIDPQQRIMLELAWHAIEDSGIVADEFPGRIGVFCGTGNNSYYLENVLKNPEKLADYGALQAMVANEKDYTATRIAHKLNLNGPAVNIQTACSTSLVAVCQAVEALRSGECEVAIAGAASLSFPQEQPHIPEEGSIKSHDGHTRPFDREANGTVFSDGGGLVVLKRLDYAIEDEDRVTAVIKGVAVNNDGAQKGSFSAPSEEGQKNVILAAQQDAGLTADKIGYIEAHGTATPIGDPIEVSALKAVFEQNSKIPEAQCLLGSVKSNLGHLTAAAGVTGLIKSALSVSKGQIPASINFTSPNPDLRLESSPFSVATTTATWKQEIGQRYAGISSFGIGGTNAHVIISGYDAEPATASAQTPTKLPLCLSANSPKSLADQARQLETFLLKNTDTDIDHLKNTYCFHRQALKYRQAILGTTRDSILSELSQFTKNASDAPTKDPKIIFMFPGQGTQVNRMGKKLYNELPLFRAHLDNCIEICKDEFNVDLIHILFSDDPSLHLTENTQIALFSVGYAIASSLMELGIKPDGMMGHSIGELAAATLSGVFDLHTAIRVVLTRGRVMQRQASGSMLAVESSFDAIKHLIPDSVVLSAQNTPESLTLSGEDVHIEQAKEALEKASIHCTKLRTSHAFHSPMMIPAEQAFITELKGIHCKKPSIPFISCVSGDWITDEQASDTRYWASQIVAPVQFKGGTEKLSKWSNLIVIDCGPRRVASHLLSQCLEDKDDLNIITALPKPTEEAEDSQFIACLGNIWKTGLSVDWRKLARPIKPAMGFLPPYAFEHKDFYIAPQASHSAFNLEQELSKSFDSNQSNFLGDLTQLSQGLQQQFAAMNNNFLDIASLGASPVSIQETQVVSGTNLFNDIEADTMTTNAISQLKTLFSDTSGIDLNDANPDATFFELGLDSLFLTQLALKLKKTFKSKVTFRQLMNEYSSFNKLATKLEGDGALTSAPVATPNQAPVHIDTPSVSAPLPVSHATTTNANGSPLNSLLSQQLQLVNSQIALLNQLSQGQAGAPVQASVPATTQTSGTAELSDTQDKKPFGAGTRINVKRSNELSADQQQNLEKLSQRYNAKFSKSKDFAQANRSQLADPRVVSGFRDKLKEVIYPIVVEKSAGAHLWDIDGNCLIDVTCGFGSNFFGNGAEFIRSAVAKQLETGYEIGPQNPLTEKVSKKFCQLTQLERVAFCNTGSEAVLGAIRLARTVTGKEHIVMFENDYHGINDEVIVHRGSNGLPLPAAAGIPGEAVANTMILDYGDPQSLKYIEENADDIAAVLIEPVQSRNPELQPKEFVQELRSLCDQNEMALIFDEVITGFRLGPRGAQGHFDIPADIATYGKIIGGGMPIGVIGGKSKYMDALDGGQWRYGDDSSPEVGVTYFAGTFVRHPLAMAAANAVLDKLIAEPTIQQDLGNKTAAMVEQMNLYASQRNAPIKVVNCQSLFRFKIPQDIAYEELIFTLLREKGIHIWDARPCFLTTAHSDEDIAAIIKAFEEAVDEMLSLGFFPELDPSKNTNTQNTEETASLQNTPPVPGARLGKDSQGKPAWFIRDPEQPGKYRMLEQN